MPKLIKQAIIFRAELPEAAHLEKHLLELPYEKISQAELSRASFIKNDVTGDLVTTFVGGYNFTLPFGEEMLPHASGMAVA